MMDIITYIIGVVACSAVFTLFYRTAMHRHTSFRTARIYLLASLVAAAIIPALDIPVWNVPPIEVAAVSGTVSAAGTPLAAPATDWTGIALWALWGAGIALLTVMMARQAARIARIKKRAEVFGAHDCEIALSGEIDAPFSFLDTVFIGRGTPGDEVRQIVLHEGSHIRHRHSQEKIAAEVLKNLMWFNPFAWWTASLLCEVHEFEADRDVLDGGATVDEYFPLIFRQIFGCVPELSVGLGDSLTKKRLLMMKTNLRSTKFGWLRVAGVLPLAAGLVLLFSFTSRPPEIIYTETPEAAAQEPQKGGDVPTSSDVMAVPPGGINAFRNWIASQITYPEAAKKAGISGKVIMRFVVERDGSLSGLEAIESPDRSLTDEAIRVLRLSPKWTPGTTGGKPARTFYILPVEFVLGAGPASRSAATPAGEIAVVGHGTQIGNFLNLKEEGEPLRFLDGKQITIAQMDAIDMNGIESVSVLKDGSAIEAYGEAGKDGVIVITSKGAGTPETPSTTGEIAVVGYGTQRREDGDVAVTSERGVRVIHISMNDSEDGKPLMILNGEQITKEQMDTLDPGTIESVSVLKDASAIEAYGEAGNDGVIVITSKSAK